MGVTGGRGRAPSTLHSTPSTRWVLAKEQNAFADVGFRGRQREEGGGLSCGLWLADPRVPMSPGSPPGRPPLPHRASGQEGRTKAPFLPGRARAVMASPSARLLVLSGERCRRHEIRRAWQDSGGQGRCLHGRGGSPHLWVMATCGVGETGGAHGGRWGVPQHGSGVWRCLMARE